MYRMNLFFANFNTTIKTMSQGLQTLFSPSLEIKGQILTQVFNVFALPLVVLSFLYLCYAPSQAIYTKPLSPIHSN